MFAYILRRLLLIPPTLIGIMVINFAVVQVLPGGPVEQLIAQITGEDVAARHGYPAMPGPRSWPRRNPPKAPAGTAR